MVSGQFYLLWVYLGLISPNWDPSMTSSPSTGNGASSKMPYGHTSFYFTLLYCASQMFWFLLIEGKTFHQQKDYDSLLPYSLYSSGLGTEATISPRRAVF